MGCGTLTRYVKVNDIAQSDGNKLGVYSQIIEADNAPDNKYTIDGGFNLPSNIKLQTDGNGNVCMSAGYDYRMLVYLPLGCDYFTFSYKTGIKCSIMVHVKFIDTQDFNKEWNMNSWDDTALPEDVLVNQVVSIVDDTNWHSFTYGIANNLKDKEGYFIVEIAQAYDINPSAHNNGVDVAFDYRTVCQFENQQAITDWINKSRPITEHIDGDGIWSPSIIPQITRNAYYCGDLNICNEIIPETYADRSYPSNITNTESYYDETNDKAIVIFNLDKAPYQAPSDGTAHEVVNILKVYRRDEDGTNLVDLTATIVSINPAEHLWGVADDISNGLIPGEKYIYTIEVENTDNGNIFRISKYIDIPLDAVDYVGPVTSLHVTSACDGTGDINISFSGVFDTIGYRIYENGVDIGWAGTAGVGIKSVDLHGRTVGTTYTYDVECVPAAGYEEYLPRASVSGKYVKTGRVSNPAVVLSTVDTNEFTLTWPATPTGATLVYFLTYLTSDNSLIRNEYTPSASLTYTAYGLEKDVSYYVKYKTYADDNSSYCNALTEPTQIDVTTNEIISSLSQPSLNFTDNGEYYVDSVNCGRNIGIDIIDDIDNAERYELYIDGTQYVIVYGVTFNTQLQYDISHIVKIVVVNDTYTISNERTYNRNISKPNPKPGIIHRMKLYHSGVFQNIMSDMIMEGTYEIDASLPISGYYMIINIYRRVGNIFESSVSIPLLTHTGSIYNLFSKVSHFMNDNERYYTESVIIDRYGNSGPILTSAIKTWAEVSPVSLIKRDHPSIYISKPVNPHFLPPLASEPDTPLGTHGYGDGNGNQIDNYDEFLDSEKIWQIHVSANGNPADAIAVGTVSIRFGAVERAKYGIVVSLIDNVSGVEIMIKSDVMTNADVSNNYIYNGFKADAIAAGCDVANTFICKVQFTDGGVGTGNIMYGYDNPKITLA